MRVLKVPRGFGRINGCLEGSRIMLEGIIGSWMVWEGILLKRSGMFQEGLGGSRMILRRSRRVREVIGGTEGSRSIPPDLIGSRKVW